MVVAIHKAKTNLSRLIDAALAGEEIIFARGAKPVVKHTPLHAGRFRFGLLEGKLGAGPDFFEPLPDNELAAWEGRG
jgi:antitoxin (DNA-binding transcriptional repressor) of toxin-antitoxin stability system